MGQWGKEERGGDTPGFCIHRPPPPPDMKSLIKHWSSSSGSAFITSHTNAFTHTSSHRHSSSASWHTKPTSTRERHPSTKKTQKTEKTTVNFFKRQETSDIVRRHVIDVIPEMGSWLVCYPSLLTVLMSSRLLPVATPRLPVSTSTTATTT